MYRLNPPLLQATHAQLIKRWIAKRDHKRRETSNAATTISIILDDVISPLANDNEDENDGYEANLILPLDLMEENVTTLDGEKAEEDAVANMVAMIPSAPSNITTKPNEEFDSTITKETARPSATTLMRSFAFFCPTKNVWTGVMLISLVCLLGAALFMIGQKYSFRFKILQEQNIDEEEEEVYLDSDKEYNEDTSECSPRIVENIVDNSEAMSVQDFPRRDTPINNNDTTTLQRNHSLSWDESLGNMKKGRHSIAGRQQHRHNPTPESPSRQLRVPTLRTKERKVARDEWKKARDLRSRNPVEGSDTGTPKSRRLKPGSPFVPSSLSRRSVSAPKPVAGSFPSHLPNRSPIRSKSVSGLSNASRKRQSSTRRRGTKSTAAERALYPPLTSAGDVSDSSSHTSYPRRARVESESDGTLMPETSDSETDGSYLSSSAHSTPTTSRRQSNPVRSPTPSILSILSIPSLFTTTANDYDDNETLDPRPLLSPSYPTSDQSAAHTLSQQVQNLQDEKEQLAQSLARCEDELRHVQSDRDKLWFDVDVFKTTSDTISLERDRLVSELRQTRDQADDASRSCEEALQEKEAWAAQLAAVRTELSRTRSEHQLEIDTLRKECTEEIERWKFAARVMAHRQQTTGEDASEEEVPHPPLNIEEIVADPSIVRRDWTDPSVARAILDEDNERIVVLERRLAQSEQARQTLHRRIQELQGNLLVYVRVRPFLASMNENDTDESSIAVGLDHKSLALSRGKGEELHKFYVDRVFGPSAGQDNVYDHVSDLVQSAMEGYNVCLFSYGQTGSGKTHTLLGAGQGEMQGLLPRAMETIFDQAQMLVMKGGTVSLQVSVLEVYNDQLKDLLVSDSIKYPPTLAMKRTIEGRTYVDGLIWVDLNVSDSSLGRKQWRNLLSTALASRSVASTKMNEVSSRSHLIFMVEIQITQTGTTSRGRLHLCDLAGSERLLRSQPTKSSNPAIRLKETQSINKSLSCLGDVFMALGQGSSHVPYRNSKLTYLLQDCFRGRGKALLFVHVSPSRESVGESLCSLRFAQRAGQITLGRPTKHIRGQPPSSGRNTPPRPSTPISSRSA